MRITNQFVFQLEELLHSRESIQFTKPLQFEATPPIRKQIGRKWAVVLWQIDENHSKPLVMEQHGCVNVQCTMETLLKLCVCINSDSLFGTRHTPICYLSVSISISIISIQGHPFMQVWMQRWIIVSASGLYTSEIPSQSLLNSCVHSTIHKSP